MANFSIYLAGKLLDAALRNITYTAGANLHIALFTSGVGLETNNQVNELSGSGYSRKAVTFDTPTDDTTQNSANVSFGPATADWEPVTHAAIVDSSTAGEILYWVDINPDVSVLDTEQFVFNAGDFVVQHQ